MSDKEQQKVSINVSEVERVMRRLLATKEVIDSCLEACADILARARPQGDANQPKKPATFGSKQPTGETIESADAVPWSESVGS